MTETQIVLGICLVAPVLAMSVAQIIDGWTGKPDTGWTGTLVVGAVVAVAFGWTMLRPDRAQAHMTDACYTAIVELVNVASGSVAELPAAGESERDAAARRLDRYVDAMYDAEWACVTPWVPFHDWAEQRQGEDE